MKKHLLAVFTALIVLAVTAFGVFAETENPEASITILGDVLAVTTGPIALSGVTLDGTDQTATSASDVNNWSAIDPTGTGAGWDLTIESTDFTAGGHSIDISAIDQHFMIQLLDEKVALVEGNTKPASQVTSLTVIPDAGTTALKFLSASAGTGMGSYTLNPNFTLDIPAETYAGAYTATVTVTIAAAP